VGNRSETALLFYIALPQVLLSLEEADEHDAQQALHPGSRPADPVFVERVERVLNKARMEHYY